MWFAIASGSLFLKQFPIPESEMLPMYSNEEYDMHFYNVRARNIAFQTQRLYRAAFSQRCGLHCEDFVPVSRALRKTGSFNAMRDHLFTSTG